MKDNLKYSIVVPTYNEEKDIEETIKYLLSMKYDNYDVIIVDDSNDNTPNIIKKYASDKLKLIIPKVRKGRSEARNIGIKASECDAVVILNADVHLPKNFLNQIDALYKEGYDAVACFSQVKNLESAYARFIDLNCLDRVYNGVYQKWKETIGYFWTEGFSVRKDLLMKTSLFPSNDIIPIVAGEDVRLMDELRKYNCNGIYEESIVVSHIAPSTFKEFWYIRTGRGEGTPQVRRFIDKWSFKKIFFITMLKAIKRFAMLVLVVPNFIKGYQLARHSFKNKFFEIFTMTYVYSLEQIAMSYGEFKSFFNVYNKTKNV